MRGSSIYTGTMDSVRDYESVGEDCDIIILQMRQNYIVSAVIYKR